ncbi:MAG TPA: DUF3300 domain-containing protein [Terriglobales bacterium]|nr:DUF3300 domain-containing protein [Terriglobales bacterium]
MAKFIRGLQCQLTAVMCSMLLIPGELSAAATDLVGQQDAAPSEQAAKIPNDQLDSLVAPIALYPDPLLAQVLAASTYPLEIMQLQQWLGKNKDLKDKALQEAVMKQPWDATVQALAALPDVVKRLSDDIQWTTDLGNAVLAQQSDVMDAVQRMRAKAQGTGNLKSTEQMTVETKVVENKQVIVVEQSKPDVVYVPSYNPTVVYGAPAYPYPPIAYPPPGYYAAGMALSFGVGMMVGAAWGGGWCCNSGWGGNNNININNNNTFVNNSNRQNNVSNRSGNRTGNNSWQHNSQHRGGAPYSNRATANKYGGTARGDSMGSRQANARQNQGQLGGRGQGAQAGTMDRGGRQQSGAGNRGAGGANSVGANRGGGGGDRVGNRSVSSGGGSKGGGAFGGGSGGMSGSSARASSSRGASSMGSRGGRSGGGGRRR